MPIPLRCQSCHQSDSKSSSPLPTLSRQLSLEFPRSQSLLTSLQWMHSVPSTQVRPNLHGSSSSWYVLSSSHLFSCLFFMFFLFFSSVFFSFLLLHVFLCFFFFFFNDIQQVASVSFGGLLMVASFMCGGGRQVTRLTAICFF